MEITYRRNKLRNQCEDFFSLRKAYGEQQAKKIMQRISELCAAPNLYDVSLLPHTGFHPLKGDRKEQFAVYIVHPHRIVFSPNDGDSLDLRTVTSIEILELQIDYH